MTINPKSSSILVFVFTLLLSLLHFSQAQNELRNLQEVSFGDVSLPPDSFALSSFLTIYYQFNNDNTITMAIHCSIPNQYFAIGFGDQMTGSDMWVFEIVNSEVTARDYIGLRRGRPTLDTANGGQENLERLGYEITPTFTLVKVKRLLNTGDSSDAVIQPGLTNFIYATGSSPTMVRHTSTQRDSNSAVLIENSQEPEVTTPEENNGLDTSSTPSDESVQTTRPYGDISLPANSFALGDFLTVNYEFNNDNTITMTFKCNLPNQYFGVGFGSSMSGSDIWTFEIVNSEIIVSDYVGLEQGYPTRDTDNGGKDDLQLLGYEITPTYTLVKVKRATDTGDTNDKTIQPGMQDMIYATANSPTISYHAEGNQRGWATILLAGDFGNPEPPSDQQNKEPAIEDSNESSPTGNSQNSEPPSDQQSGDPVIEESNESSPTRDSQNSEPPSDQQDKDLTTEEPNQISSASWGDITLSVNSFALGDFLTVNYEFNNDNTITMTFKCNLPNQYFGVGFGSSMSSSDIWTFEIVNSEIIVSDYVGLEQGYPTIDTDNGGKDDLQLLGYEIAPTYTLVKVKRATDTGDTNDKTIRPGMQDMIYATANSPTISYHAEENQRGWTTILLVGDLENSEPLPSQQAQGNAFLGAMGDISLPSNYFQIKNLFIIYYEFNEDNSITMAIKFNIPNQYFGIGFGGRTMTGSDMWVFEIVDSEVTVTDYIGLLEGPPTRDTANGGKEDLQRLGYEISPTHTIVKVKRSLNTEDPNDSILSQGWTDMIYATAASRLMSKHRSSDRGSVRVPLIEGIQGYTLVDDPNNTNDVHGILNIIAWGFLVDIAIIAVRFLRGIKFAFGNIIISAQLIHSAIMWLVFIMSSSVSAVLLNQNRSTRGSKLTGDGPIDFHFINGLIMMFLSIVTVLIGVTNMLFLKSYKKTLLADMNIKKLHKVLGYAMYIMTKVNIIIGAIIHKDGAWEVPVYIYLGVLLLVHSVIQRKYMNGFKYSNKISNVSQKPSAKPHHVALMSALNSGFPREKLLLDFPDVKWVQLGNRVYDLTDWIHPGGNFIIEAVTGREVGRYIYGNYALEGSNLKPHKHSTMALSQINKFYVGEVTNIESVLVSKNNSGGTQEVVAYGSEHWRISSRKQISDTVAQINFINDDFKVKNFGNSLPWLGRHFRLSLATENSPARLYTTAFSLTEANTRLREALYQYFEEIMADGSPTFTYDSTYLVPQNELPLFIKNYSSANGLSKMIHTIDVNSGTSNFRIEGPVSRGLELTLTSGGTQTIICAGTGILPFIDFLNMFLWKNIYDLIKKKAGIEKAKEINILNIPFDSFMNGLKVNFFGAFANEKEALGLDIIQKLAEVSNKYNTNNFNPMMKGYSNKYIQEVQGTFSIEFLQKYVNLNEDRFYVVGPPKMNEEVPKALVKLGVKEEKIILV